MSGAPQWVLGGKNTACCWLGRQFMGAWKSLMQDHCDCQGFISNEEYGLSSASQTLMNHLEGLVKT